MYADLVKRSLASIVDIPKRNVLAIFQITASCSVDQDYGEMARRVGNTPDDESLADRMTPRVSQPANRGKADRCTPPFVSVDPLKLTFWLSNLFVYGRAFVSPEQESAKSVVPISCRSINLLVVENQSQLHFEYAKSLPHDKSLTSPRSSSRVQKNVELSPQLGIKGISQNLHKSCDPNSISKNSRVSLSGVCVTAEGMSMRIRRALDVIAPGSLSVRGARCNEQLYAIR